MTEPVRYIQQIDLRRPEWSSQARCKGKGELFFPEHGDHSSVAKAKAICRNCPVRQDCLDYALDRNEVYGVWGGTSPKERKRLRYEAAIANPTPTCEDCGTMTGWRWHMRNGYAPCAPCRTARTRYVKSLKTRKVTA